METVERRESFRQKLVSLGEMAVRPLKAWPERRREARRAQRMRRFEERRRLLVLDRPDYERGPESSLSLEMRYVPLEAEGELDKAFERLRQQIFAAIEVDQRLHPNRPAWFKEWGRMEGRRAYFFIKPAGQKGLLFERAASGWIVARADKIVDRNLFLRNGEVADRVTCHRGRHSPPGSAPRVSSHALGGGLLPFLVFEQKVLIQVGLGSVAERLSAGKRKDPRRVSGDPR